MVYTLAPDNSGIEAFEEIKAPDDAAAISLVTSQSRLKRLELWQGTRKVQRFSENHGPALVGRLRYPFRTPAHLRTQQPS